MPFDPEDNLFLLPGPVKVHPRVREAMARATMAHRGPEFTEVNRRLFAGLRRLMGTRHVAVLAGSGTAGMDAAVSNLVHWNDRAVGLENGEFGARMAGLVERYAGPNAVRIASPWGQGHDLAALEAELSRGGVSAVCLTLNESSTGVMNQGREIARLCRKHDALCIADTITATGSVPVPFEDWGLDVSIVGSQKCIGGPAGLAFVAVSERAYARLDSPTLYLDLKRHVDRAEGEDQTPFTPAVPLHLACAAALDHLFAEGLEARFQRTRRVAQACRAAAEAAGLELAAAEGFRSDTLTAMRYPPAPRTPRSAPPSRSASTSWSRARRGRGRARRSASATWPAPRGPRWPPAGPPSRPRSGWPGTRCAPRRRPCRSSRRAARRRARQREL